MGRATSTQKTAPAPASRKRWPRRDRFRGQIYDDWYEQQLEELKHATNRRKGKEEHTDL